MLAKPIWYLSPKGTGRTAAKGINAEALPMICDVWLQARLQGVLDKNPSGLRAAAAAELIVRGLARVGILALVDEAAGYQEERNRRALQEILDRFLVKELAEWAKSFPDDFYKQIYRLRGWAWRGRGVNPPQIVAHYTKDLVYSRLAPGVMEEMRELASKEPKRHRWHQWLSKEGKDALQAHFHRLLALMTVATSWDQMMAMVDQVAPKVGATLLLPVMTVTRVTDSDPT